MELHGSTLEVWWVFGCVVLAACSSGPRPEPGGASEAASTETEEATSEEGDETPAEAGGYEEPPTEAAERRRRRALNRVIDIAERAKAYFATEQNNCRGVEDCAEPWHHDPERDPGMPVLYDAYVFPGGTGVALRTNGAVPEGGEPRPIDFELEGAERTTVDDLRETLDLAFPERTHFRYTYETGPGGGDDASVTVRAEADFKPDSPGTTTVLREVQVRDGRPEIVRGCGPTRWNDAARIAEHLRSENATDRKFALQRLDAYAGCFSESEIREEIAPLLVELYEGDEGLRSLAMEQLVALRTEGAEEAYLEEYRTDATGHRYDALASLAALEVRSIVPELVEEYRSAEDQGRKLRLLDAFADVPDPRMVDALTDTLELDVDDHSIFLHERSCRVLGLIGRDHPDALDRSDRRALVRALYLSNRRGQKTRRPCSLAVQRVGAPAVPALIDVLNGEHEGVRRLLARYAEDSRDYPPNRAQPLAVRRLTTLRSSRAAELFAKRLTDEVSQPKELPKRLVLPWRIYEARTLEQMIEGLGRLGGDGARDLLERALRGDFNDAWSVVQNSRVEFQLRSRAARALVALGDRSAVEVLVEMARDGTIELLERRAEALEKAERLSPMDPLSRHRFQIACARAAAMLGTGDDLDAFRDLAAAYEGGDTEPVRKKLESFLPALEAAEECESRPSDAETAACWSEKLTADAAVVRRKAARELSRLPPEVSGPRVVEHLSTPDLRARATLVEALYDHPRREAIQTIDDMVADAPSEPPRDEKKSLHRLRLLRAWLVRHFE